MSAPITARIGRFARGLRFARVAGVAGAGPGAAAILTTLLITVGASAAPPQPDRQPIPGAYLDAIETFETTTRGLFAATVQSIVPAPADVDDPSAARSFAVVLDGRPRIVLVRRHAVRTARCTLLVSGEAGALVPSPLAPARTWRGELADDTSIRVAVSFDEDDRITGVVHDDLGSTWGIEPVDRRMAGAATDLHVVYRADDVMPTDAVCATTDDLRVELPELGRGPEADAAAMLAVQDDRFDPQDPDPSFLAEMMARLAAGDGGGGPMDGPEGLTDSRAQIAFEADFPYYQLNGSSVDQTVADIDAVMNAVGLIYESQTGICYTTTGYVVRTSAGADPYATTDPVELIFAMRSEWNANINLPHDVGHLFTGRNLDGSTVGIAFVGVICTNSRYGLSQSRFTSNFTNRTQLTAHELGHNWNACHCNLSECTGGAGDPDCGIMNAFINGATVFGSRSITTIEAHRQSRFCLDDCQTVTYVDFAWNGPENGSLANPWNTFQEGHDNAQLGTEVRIIPGLSSETGVFNRNIRVIVEGDGTVRIGGQP